MLLTRITRLLCYLLLIAGLSSALLLVPFEQVVWANENTTALPFPHCHRLLDNANQLPASLTAWKKVDLVYNRMFPYDQSRQPHPPAGCVVLPAISHHLYKQSTGITTPTAVPMLRCRERIDLLRPARWVKNRICEQNRQGYLWLNIPDMDIMDVQVHMVAVRSSSFNPAIMAMKSASSRPVIGLFIRHTMNVKLYTFKDTITGKLDRIKATPNHLFYVVNRQRYIPVSKLSPDDKMINVLGHPVTLVCPTGKSSHCGQSYHPGQVITVYNLEVYGQHRYFVGESGIMVHNGYQCADCKDDFLSLRALDRHAKDTGHRPYRCRVCNRSLARSSSLDRHLKIHTGKQPFKCTTCGLRFNRKDNLYSHYSTSINHFKNFIKQLENNPLNAPADESPVAAGVSEGTESLRTRSRSPVNPGISLPAKGSVPNNPPPIPPIPAVDNKSFLWAEGDISWMKDWVKPGDL